MVFDINFVLSLIKNIVLRVIGLFLHGIPFMGSKKAYKCHFYRRYGKCQCIYVICSSFYKYLVKTRKKAVKKQRIGRGTQFLEAHSKKSKNYKWF